MAYLVDDALESYALAHTSEAHPIYAELRDETYGAMEFARMQVGHLEGSLLTMLARLTNARRAVEVGTFTGYSALAIAEGMAEGGKLITCDIDPVATSIAQSYFARADWGDRIELRLGPALSTLAELEGPFDLAFLDAAKEEYVDYWELLVPKMRPGGLLVADNVLWSGRVLAPESDSDRAIVRFNEHVRSDARVEAVMLTLRDGVTLARRR